MESTQPPTQPQAQITAELRNRLAQIQRDKALTHPRDNTHGTMSSDATNTSRRWRIISNICDTFQQLWANSRKYTIGVLFTIAVFMSWANHQSAVYSQAMHECCMVIWFKLMYNEHQVPCRVIYAKLSDGIDVTWPVQQYYRYDTILSVASLQRWLARYCASPANSTRGDPHHRAALERRQCRGVSNSQDPPSLGVQRDQIITIVFAMDGDLYLTEIDMTTSICITTGTPVGGDDMGVQYLPSRCLTV
jgi:hypothetical protein